MRRWLGMAMAMILVLSIGQSALAAGSTSESWTTILPKLKKLQAEEREEAYMGVKFPVSGWLEGDVLSNDPLVIVLEAGQTYPDYAAKLRISTGEAKRMDTELVAIWDEIWIKADGSASLVMTERAKILPDYFSADHQRKFRGTAYLGLYPWLYIPTDVEAVAKRIAKVDYDYLADRDAYAFAAIPNRINDRASFEEIELPFVPRDVAQSRWSYASIIDLMKKGIAKGYQDDTIRPARVLSRAEFLSLLARAVHIEINTKSKTSYPDAAKHWSSSLVAAAEASGIVPPGKSDLRFRPDEAITRAEMAVWLASALKRLDLGDSNSATLIFPDTKQTSDEIRRAIGLVAKVGLIQGYDDGTFKPDKPLTREQGFAVTFRLIDIQ